MFKYKKEGREAFSQFEVQREKRTTWIRGIESVFPLLPEDRCFPAPILEVRVSSFEFLKLFL